MSFLSRLCTILKSNTSIIYISRTYTSINPSLKHYTENVFKKSFYQQNRNVSKFFRKDTTERLRIKDNVPDEYELIYRNQMDKYLFYAQVFSSVFAGLVTIVLITQQDFANLQMNIDLWQEKPGSVKNEFFVYFGMFIVVCALLQVIVAKMPLRIYNYPKQKDYIAVFYGALPGSSKRVVFQKKDISKVEEVGMLPWKGSSYELENKGKIILLENSFRTPADLSIMLGYQKSEDEEDSE